MVRVKVNAHSYDWKSKHATEPGGGKSLAQPNESYTIRQLLERSAQGVSLTAIRVYDGEEYEDDESGFESHDMEKIHSQDFVDQEDIVLDIVDKRNARAKVAQEKKSLADKKAADEAAELEAIRQERRERLKAKEEPKVKDDGQAK